MGTSYSLVQTLLL